MYVESAYNQDSDMTAHPHSLIRTLLMLTELCMTVYSAKVKDEKRVISVLHYIYKCTYTHIYTHAVWSGSFLSTLGGFAFLAARDVLSRILDGLCGCWADLGLRWTQVSGVFLVLPLIFIFFFFISFHFF